MNRTLIAGLILILAACTTETNPTTTVDDPITTTPGSTTVEPTTTGSVTLDPTTTQPGDLLFPDVIAVEVTDNGDGTYRFDVTISSPYDSNEQYADAWRVLGPDGTEYGVRILTHPHANEQPFTRSLDGVEIPAEVSEVTIEGRDFVNGWGGATIKTSLN